MFSILIKEEFTLLQRFVTRPIDRKRVGFSNNETFKRVLALISIELPIMVMIIIVTSSLEEFVDLDLGDHKLEEMMQKSPLLFVFSGVILAPILEEFFFRFFLTFRYAFYFKWPLHIIQNIIYTPPQHRLINSRRLWQRVFPYFFYLSVIAFGFVHITNFENAENYLWAIPLLTLPQLVIGVFLGYTRVRYGFLWAVLLHALHNGILLAPVLIFDIK